MKAIILSAGKGTRVAGINDSIPKVLLPLLDKPMLEWQINLLKKHGITKIAINTHHLADKIKSFLGDGSKFGVSIIYSYEEELLGTAGSLYNFKGFFDEPFVVIYGDVISNMDLSKLIKFHKDNKASATLVVHPSSHPEDSDIVEFDNKNRVTALHHKPGSAKYGNMGNAALYVCQPEILGYINKNDLPCDFIKNIFPKLLGDNKKLLAYNTKEFVKDAGTPKRISEVEEELKRYM